MRCFVLSVYVFCSFFVQIDSFAAKFGGAEEIGLEYLMLLDLPQVSVASKQEEDIISANGTVYVITENEIKQFGWKNMREILQSIPNIDLCWTWNYVQGGQRGLSGAFNGTVLMIDGNPYTTINSDQAMMKNFPAHRIKRIEILQGPNSTLYGSASMQGVINIITKTVDEDRDLSEIEMLVGDVGTKQLSGVFKKIFSDDVSIALSASYYESDQDYDEIAQFVQSDELYSGNSFLNSLREYDASRFQMPVESYTLDGHVKIHGFYAGFNVNRELSSRGIEFVETNWGRTIANDGNVGAYIGYDHRFNDALELKTRLFHRDMTFHYAQGRQDTSRIVSYDFSQERTHLTVNAYYEFNKHQFLLGYELTRQWPQKVITDQAWNESFLMYPVTEKWDLLSYYRHSIYLQDSFKINDRFKIIAGFRYDNQIDIVCDNLEENSNPEADIVVPRVSLIYQPTENSALKLIYGEGFRNPNEKEIYLTRGRSVLEPLESEMIDLNYTFKAEFGSVMIYNVLSIYEIEAGTAYNNIRFQTDLKMIEDLTVRGVEDVMKISYQKVSGFLGFRVIDKDEQIVDSGEKEVLDAPKVKFKCGISYNPLDHLMLSLFIDHWDETHTEAKLLNTRGTSLLKVDSFTVANLHVQVGEFNFDELKGSMSLYIENLTNEKYYHANTWSYNPLQYMQAPRSYRFKVNFNF